MALASASYAQSVTPSLTPHVQGNSPVSWRRFRDPSGVTLAHPRGWQVQVDPQQGQVRLRGTGAQQLLIWPIFMRGPVSPELSSRLLMTLAHQSFPQAEWGEPQRIADCLVRSVHMGDYESVAGLAWVPSRSGSAGVFYCAATPAGNYRRNESTFAGIAKSFQLAGPDLFQAHSVPSLTFESWDDPQEKAFYTEVPQGWQVSGGMQRVAKGDLRPSVRASSPDGGVQVYFGDAEIPKHQVPTERLTASGFPEGSWAPSKSGGSTYVRAYLAGSEFAMHYLTHHTAANCNHVQAVSIRQRDDAAQAIQSVHARHLNPHLKDLRFDAGDVIYTCQADDQLRNGYAFSATSLDRQESGSCWTVDWNYGYLAVPERAAEAELALRHIVNNYRLNPEWMRSQSHLTPHAAEIVADVSAQLTQLIDSTNQFRQITLEDIFRGHSNIILQVDDVIGPDGTVYQVHSGNQFYWIDPRGQIIGTETPMRPDVDFRELLHLP